MQPGHQAWCSPGRSQICDQEATGRALQCRVLRLLGTGSFGEVHLVEVQRSGGKERTALKLTLPASDRLADHVATRLNDFESEAEVIKRMQALTKHSVELLAVGYFKVPGIAPQGEQQEQKQTLQKGAKEDVGQREDAEAEQQEQQQE